jgi:hypothetical protein
MMPPSCDLYDLTRARFSTYTDSPDELQRYHSTSYFIGYNLHDIYLTSDSEGTSAKRMGVGYWHWVSL